MENIIYSFDPEKNAKLIELRGISFEQIIILLESGMILDIVKNPSHKYSNQKIYVIELNNYVYLVPFVEDGKKIFLKTAFPSRKATKRYLDSGD